jgi:putative protein-disulfide isomerase
VARVVLRELPAVSRNATLVTMTPAGHLIFLYDPLCGWCYGSMPAVAALGERDDWIVEPLSSGLFAGNPERRIDAGHAAHIEAADERIAAMTGQVFSDAYRRDVLGDANQAFDSGPATQALCAVSRWDRTREIEALHALQRERWVRGRDITQTRVLVDALAAALGGSSDEWAARLSAPRLKAETQLRINRARQLMDAANVPGVPTLLWASREGLRLLPGQWLFSGRPLADHLVSLA